MGNCHYVAAMLLQYCHYVAVLVDKYVAMLLAALLLDLLALTSPFLQRTSIIHDLLEDVVQGDTIAHYSLMGSFLVYVMKFAGCD